MVEVAEDEIRNLVKVWALVFVSLSYCYLVGKIIPKGFPRLVAILPVISLFIALPLNLTYLHLTGLTAFFITWLANFKLLLFAFANPPLSSRPPLSFLRFLAIACMPINITTNPQKLRKSPWNYIIKGSLLCVFMLIYGFSHRIPQKVLWVVYFFHIYFTMELTFASLASAAKLLIGLELEPQFNDPLLSTSLQDFWGRRWNLMVTSILRPTVYLPTRDLMSPLVGRRLATPMAVMCTFTVSALMHELIFYYLGRTEPTFEVTWFFLLHGLCLCVEMAAKRRFGEKWRVPRWVSGPMTLGFTVGTGFWLFLPPLLRAGFDVRGIQEYAAIGELAKNVTSYVTFQ